MRSLFLFLLKTRVSPRLVVFLFVYAVLVASMEFISYRRANPYIGTVAEVFVASFAFASIAFGGLIIVKSDADFLLALPVSRVRLSLYFFVVQALGGIVVLSAILGAYTFLVGGPALLSLPLYVLTFNSWSVLATRLSTVKRWVIATVVSAWFLTSLVGFPFSPSSAVTGSPYGLVALTLVSAASLALAVRQLYMTEELVAMVPSLSFSGKYVTRLKFLGRGRLTVLSYYSQIASWTVRVPYFFLLFLSSAAAFLLYYSTRDLFPLIRDYLAFVVSVAILSGVSISGVNLLLGERLWVAFASTTRVKYLRAAMLSGLAFYFQLSLPFAVVDFLLGGLTYSAGLNLLLLGPPVYVVRNYAETYLSPQQVKDTFYRPERTLGSYLVPLIMGSLVFTISVLSIFFRIVTILSALVMTIIAVILLTRKSLEALADRMVTGGFS